MSEVVTGDAVVLDVQIAQLPVRALSAILDILVVAFVYFVGLMLAAAAMSQLDEAWIVAFIIIFTVLAMVGYPVIIETLTRGRSLGKMALGLRVVSDDGGPERFRQALFRALAAVVEIWVLLGSPAVICSLFSSKGKRVGDLFAGTVVVSERGPRLAPPPMMPPQLAGWAASLQLSGLSAGQAEVARQFLSRAMQLDPQLRARMAYRIAADVVSCIAPPPPPGVPPSWCWPRFWPNGTGASWPGCNRSRGHNSRHSNSRHSNSRRSNSGAAIRAAAAGHRPRPEPQAPPTEPDGGGFAAPS